MTNASEKLDIMDAITSYGKQGKISLTKTFALLIVAIFIIALIATGLLVHHFSPTHVREIIKTQCNQTLNLRRSSPTEIIEIETSTETTILVEYTTIETSKEKPKLDFRLPRSVVPLSYEIKLIPFVFEGNFTFRGEVLIEVNVTEPTRNITLHADELEIDTSSVTVSKFLDESSSVRVDVSSISNDSVRNFLVIHFDDDLDVSYDYQVFIKFQGTLNDVLEGFYRSSYTVNNEKRWIAATQFQATDARKAFPCFDEPALKATFKISLARPKNMSTISNMPRLNSSLVDGIDGYVWDHFQKSVPMSTYLVAFVVSDLHYVRNGTVSLWARESAITQASFGLKIGPAILKFYEEFFQIPFPLPKIDMVALPDFSSGAMENWGLITYRESILLYEKGVSTVSNLQSIATVVAHELAHQWFGNLVTPSWWTDLWLNEGFATYMEYLGTDAVCPELKILDQFVVQELQNVFQLDALKSSHQISIKVNNPAEINNIFDRISYSKGATIIRMLEHFLTADVFKKGLTSYLTERMYSSAEQNDLWAALTEKARDYDAFEEDVKEIMDTWTLQTGFPVVTATRDYDGGIHLRQERFFLGGPQNSSGISPLWWIPVTYVSKNDENLKKIWMRAESEVALPFVAGTDDWLLLNVNQTGYYRVNYDVRNWQLLIEQLNIKDGYDKFDPKNRAQLLDDSLNLAKASYLDYDVALNVTRYLVNEREYVPWKAAFDEFDFLFEIFVRSGQFDKYKTYVLHLINGLYGDIGFNENSKDSTLTIYTRVEVLWRACMLGFRDCILNSVKQFHEWRNSPEPDRNNPISPNLRSVVYCHAIKVGGQEEWDFAWQRYLNTDVGTEKDLIMTALGCSTETWILTRYLEWAVTEGSGIRKMDSVQVFGAVSNSIIGQQLTYRFLTTNWDKIKKYIGSSLLLLIGIIRESIMTYPSEQELNEMKTFVAKKSDDLVFASRVIQQLLERAEANLEWKNKNFDKIVEWLKNFNAQS